MWHSTIFDLRINTKVLESATVDVSEFKDDDAYAFVASVYVAPKKIVCNERTQSVIRQIINNRRPVLENTSVGVKMDIVGLSVEQMVQKIKAVDYQPANIDYSKLELLQLQFLLHLNPIFKINTEKIQQSRLDLRNISDADAIAFVRHINVAPASIYCNESISEVIEDEVRKNPVLREAAKNKSFAVNLRPIQFEVKTSTVKPTIKPKTGRGYHH